MGIGGGEGVTFLDCFEKLIAFAQGVQQLVFGAYLNDYGVCLSLAQNSSPGTIHCSIFLPFCW